MINVTKKNLSYLFLALLVGGFLTVGINGLEQNLEDYFFVQECHSQPLTAQLVTAQEPQPPEKFEVKLNASSGLSIWTDLENSKILFQKNASRSFPIASLSKLMTSFVVMNLDATYTSNQPIIVTKKAVQQDGAFGLKSGEKLTTENLLAMTLIESSNDAAYVLSSYIKEKSFVELMNYYAQEMSLNQTQFYNPTGLEKEETPSNHSSARDLVKLSQFILEEHPRIFELSAHETYQVMKPNGRLHHVIEENTNELLKEYPQMIGGKTGYTDGAQQCLLTVTESRGGYLINVILNSNDHFGEMRKLIDHAR